MIRFQDFRKHPKASKRHSKQEVTMKKQLACICVLALIILSAIGCKSSKVPDWAIGKWSAGIASFEISSNDVSIDEFGMDSKMSWGKDTQIKTVAGIQIDANAKITKSTATEFGFSITAKTEIMGASTSKTVDFTIAKGNDGSYSLLSGGKTYGLTKK